MPLATLAETFLRSVHPVAAFARFLRFPAQTVAKKTVGVRVAADVRFPHQNRRAPSSSSGVPPRFRRQTFLPALLLPPASRPSPSSSTRTPSSLRRIPRLRFSTKRPIDSFRRRPQSCVYPPLRPARTQSRPGGVSRPPRSALSPARRGAHRRHRRGRRPW